MRVVTVVGARPQFIKAAVMSRAVERHNETAAAGSRIDEVLVHTGQHYDYEMSQVFFDELRLTTPGYHLSIGSVSHPPQTARMLEKIEPVLIKEAPDVVLVYGDTNSTLAGTLAAAKLRIPVAHVEAGLRSYNRHMPEEVNRLVTDHISRWRLCPTETAVTNLAREGITEGVVLVGDVMYELLRERAPAVPPAAILTRLGLRPRGYALATVHRAENTDDLARLTSIFAALAQLSRRLPVVCPLHPRTREALGRVEILLPTPLALVEPVGYGEMLALERDARIVLTDSGGVQKEAYWLGVPCVTLRDETEWVETLVQGRNVLAGASADRICEAAGAVFRTPMPDAPSEEREHAADAIVRCLVGEPM